MAKRIARNRRIISAREEKGAGKAGLFDFFRISESYTSLILGIVVVIVAAVLLIAFVRGLNIGKTPPPAPEISSTKIEPEAEEAKLRAPQAGTTYTVQKGDDLWKIAEKAYKDGYQWMRIAQANGLENPSVIYAGTKLVLPSTAPIRSSTYTVQRGDTLWSIAERRYNDGYHWVDIARTNKLANPDIIHTGNVLQLPQ